MSVSEIQLYQILKGKLGEKEAEDLVSFVKSEVKSEFDSKRDTLATKEDLANVRGDLMKSIFLVGLVQFLAIVGSVLAIVSYMVK